MAAAPAARTQLTAAGAVAWSLMILGLVLWPWTGDWRVAVTGAGVGIVVGLVMTSAARAREHRAALVIAKQAGDLALRLQPPRTE